MTKIEERLEQFALACQFEPVHQAIKMFDRTFPNGHATFDTQEENLYFTVEDRVLTLPVGRGGEGTIRPVKEGG